MYAGNLDPQCGEELLWEVFLQVGPVVNVYLPKDRVTGAHQGYGFVEFRGEEDAEYAVKVLSMVKLFGKPLRCSKSAADRAAAVDVGANLFVGNLDPDIDEKLLYDTFSAFGVVVNTPKVMRDPDTVRPLLCPQPKGSVPPDSPVYQGNSKGFGFVSFNSFEAADAAIDAMNGQHLCNRPISVTCAAPACSPAALLLLTPPPSQLRLQEGQPRRAPRLRGGAAAGCQRRAGGEGWAPTHPLRGRAGGDAAALRRLRPAAAAAAAWDGLRHAAAAAVCAATLWRHPGRADGLPSGPAAGNAAGDAAGDAAAAATGDAAAATGHGSAAAGHGSAAATRDAAAAAGVPTAAARVSTAAAAVTQEAQCVAQFLTDFGGTESSSLPSSRYCLQVKQRLCLSTDPTMPLLRGGKSVVSVPSGEVIATCTLCNEPLVPAAPARCLDELGALSGPTRSGHPLAFRQ